MERTGVPERDRMSLVSLETITDALLEILEACMRDIPDCDWLQTWTGLAKSFAFQYNPALQPRALIVFGCISEFRKAPFKSKLDFILNIHNFLYDLMVNSKTLCELFFNAEEVKIQLAIFESGIYIIPDCLSVCLCTSWCACSNF